MSGLSSNQLCDKVTATFGCQVANENPLTPSTLSPLHPGVVPTLLLHRDDYPLPQEQVIVFFFFGHL